MTKYFLALYLIFITIGSHAQDFGISGVIYGLSSKEVPVFVPPDQVKTHTLSYVKVKSGEGVYICPFLNDRSFQSILIVASTALQTGKEVFISTVRTDYQGRSLSAARYGKEMDKCANSISHYNI